MYCYTFTPIRGAFNRDLTLTVPMIIHVCPEMKCYSDRLGSMSRVAAFGMGMGSKTSTKETQTIHHAIEIKSTTYH